MKSKLLQIMMLAILGPLSACGGDTSFRTAEECVAQPAEGVCVCALSQEDQIKHEGRVLYTTYGEFAEQLSRSRSTSIIEENGWEDMVDKPLPDGLCIRHKPRAAK